MSQYDYLLPEDSIAHKPADPRDSARLLVYKIATDEIIMDTFTNIAKYIPDKSLLVLNDTKVVPARLELKKQTGGSVRILFLVNEFGINGAAPAHFGAAPTIKGLPDRKLKIGEILSLVDQDSQENNIKEGRQIVKVISQEKEEFTFELLVSLDDFSAVMVARGLTPLPPYIHSPLKEKEIREKYQTMFAKDAASVAAPTASLHFTDGVFKTLSAKKIDKAFVTLHVGRGTFSPATVEVKELHGEPIHVSIGSARDILAAKKEGRVVVAAGTTAMRVLETAADFILKDKVTNSAAGGSRTGELDSSRDFSTTTKIFIKPPYDFKIADALITNFHLPNTSLLMLLDAFLQYRGAKKSWRDIYEYAIKNGYRFYSFGDSMLVI